MKKILLLSTIFFGFGLINANPMNEDEIREKLGKLDEEAKEHIENMANAYVSSPELQENIQEMINTFFDRCECAIRKGISDPDGIECEEGTERIRNLYAKLSESDDGKLYTEEADALSKVFTQQVRLKAQLQKIEKNKQ